MTNCKKCRWFYEFTERMKAGRDIDGRCLISGFEVNFDYSCLTPNTEKAMRLISKKEVINYDISNKTESKM